MQIENHPGRQNLNYETQVNIWSGERRANKSRGAKSPYPAWDLI